MTLPTVNFSNRSATDRVQPADRLVVVTAASDLPAPGSANTQSRQLLRVLLDPADPVEQLAEHIASIELIVVQFPEFTDGRALSQSRLLRERLGYVGPIRAIGDLKPDLLAFMAACGIDQFDLAASATDIEAALADRRRFVNQLAGFAESETSAALGSRTAAGGER